MRQPKFRGFSTETNSWHYGHGWFEVDYTEEYKLEKGIEVKACLYRESSPIECELSSMGEFTGLLDSKGTEIFEGDILQASNREKGLHVVIWKDGGFQRKYRFIRKYQGEEYEDSTIVPVHSRSFIVVGNTFEQEEPLN